VLLRSGATMLQLSSSPPPRPDPPRVGVRAADLVGETVVEPPGVRVGVFTAVVGDALEVVGVTVALTDVLVGTWTGDPVGVAVGVSPVCSVPVGVAVGVSPVSSVLVGVASERGVSVEVGEGVAVGEGSGGVSPGSPGNVSAMISARLLAPSPSESSLSIGANSCPAP